jgi:FkbM family methyltransferase
MSATMVNSDIGPYEMVLLPDDHISNLIRQSGQPYESKLVAIVRELTRPDSTILDVGANLGNHTIYWAKAGRRVIAFEPNLVTRSALAESSCLNGLDELVTVYPVALGAATGTGALRALLDGNHGAIAVEPVADGEIPIVRLDDLDVPDFSVIKIDVEGDEENVLRGAQQTIGRLRPFIIAEAQAKTDDVVALLRDLGYRRIPVSLAYTPTYLYVPSLRSVSTLARSRTLVRRLLLEVARRLHVRRSG